MPEQIICPVCGSSVTVGITECPYCHTSFGGENRPETPAIAEKTTGSQPEIRSQPSEPHKTSSVRTTQPLKAIQTSPEALVPRLGDYLIKDGVITQEDLQRALALQEKRATVGRSLLLGEALMEMGLIERPVLDRIVTRQIISFHSALEEANRTLEQRVLERTVDLENRLAQIRTAAQVTQAAVSAASLDELLSSSVELLQKRFDFYLVSIFLLAEAGKTAVLTETAGENALKVKQQGGRIAVGSPSLVGWVAANNQPRLTSMGDSDFYAVHVKLVPGARAEAGLPISIGDRVVGVLDIQQKISYALDNDALAILQTIANHIAAVISNIHLLDVTRQSFKEISSLYKASQQIMLAPAPEDVLTIVTQVLAASEYPSLMAVPIGSRLRVLSSNGLKKNGVQLPSVEFLRTLSSLQPGTDPYYIKSGAMGEQSENLDGFLQHLGWVEAICFPIWCHSRLDGVYFLGASQAGQLPQVIIQSFASLASMATNALDKLYATQTMRKRLEALQTMNTISQAVSVATDIHTLYRVIHNEVVRIIGEVDFLIAEYDPKTNMIEIPYMVDSGSLVTYEPFPLGEGLVSILINSGQPLRLVENTEERAKELGAKVLGQPAKSWLGVPLIVANETIGAMVVQDLENEFRFDEDDQLLLSTLGSQVAVAIRNARLLDGMYQQAERERKLYEITNRIRSATDMKSILDITTRELRKALGARGTRIELGSVDQALPGEVLNEMQQDQEL